MLTDRFYGQHATEVPAAITAFEEVIEALAAHRPAGDALARTLEADPDLVAAHALKGFSCIILGRMETIASASQCLEGMRSAVANRPYLSAGETALAEALEARRGGRLLAVSVTDGKTLADYELASPPVFDGLAAARGRLYLSTKIGEVVCMGPAR